MGEMVSMFDEGLDDFSRHILCDFQGFRDGAALRDKTLQQGAGRQETAFFKSFNRDGHEIFFGMTHVFSLAHNRAIRKGSGMVERQMERPWFPRASGWRDEQPPLKRERPQSPGAFPPSRTQMRNGLSSLPQNKFNRSAEYCQDSAAVTRSGNGAADFSVSSSAYFAKYAPGDRR